MSEATGKITLEQTTDIPDTVLSHLLMEVQKKLLATPSDLKLGPFEHLCILLGEEGKQDEVMAFLASYLLQGPEASKDGMCVMFMLGFIYRGFAKKEPLIKL